MTAITLNTLKNTASVFLRDVIRNNITDTISPARAGTEWIFKGQPKKKLIIYPHIIITSNRRDVNLVLSNTKRINKEFNLEIEIWTESFYDRDSISDQLVTILSDPTKQDANSESIASKHLYFKEITDTDSDTYKSDTGLIRIDKMTFKFIYGGN